MSNPLKNVLRSATDPLRSGPGAGRELAGRFGRNADGFSREHVLDASCSVFLDVIRQTQGDRAAAHAKLSELAERMHAVLDQHYNPVTGRRRPNFSWDQNINVLLTDDRKRG